MSRAAGADGLTAKELRTTRDAWWSDEFTAVLRDRLAPIERQSILDVGCGTGALAQGLRQIGAQPELLVGVDIEISRLRGVREGFAAAGQHLPFPSATFSAAVAVLTLQHIPDPRPVLAEMGRVVHRSGRILIVEADNRAQRLYLPTESPALEDAYEAFWRRVAAARPQTNFRLGPQLLGLLRKAGFEQCRLEGFLATHCQDVDAATYFARTRTALTALADRYGVAGCDEVRHVFEALREVEASFGRGSIYAISTVPLFLATARV